MNQRLLNFLIALDQLLFNVLTLGKSSPDETASAAAHRLEKNGRIAGRIFRPLIDIIFGKGHCEESFNSEVSRKHLPKEYSE